MDKLQNEIRTALEQAGREHCGFPEVSWFLKTMAQAFSTETLINEKPSLIVLGEDIPRELALALADHPRFILGGSLETTHWSDTLLPRDADPVSRSACGWLLNEKFDLAENAIVVMALSSDNRRKLAPSFGETESELRRQTCLPGTIHLKRGKPGPRKCSGLRIPCRHIHVSACPHAG